MNKYPDKDPHVSRPWSRISRTAVAVGTTITGGAFIGWLFASSAESAQSTPINDATYYMAHHDGQFPPGPIQSQQELAQAEQKQKESKDPLYADIALGAGVAGAAVCGAAILVEEIRTRISQ